MYRKTKSALDMTDLCHIDVQRDTEWGGKGHDRQPAKEEKQTNRLSSLISFSLN